MGAFVSVSVPAFIAKPRYYSPRAWSAALQIRDAPGSYMVRDEPLHCRSDYVPRGTLLGRDAVRCAVGLLLVVGPTGKAVGEGVGDAQVHGAYALARKLRLHAGLSKQGRFDVNRCQKLLDGLPVLLKERRVLHTLAEVQ